MMQLRNRNLIGNQGRQTGGLTPRRLIRNWRTGDTSEESESIGAL
jgi:hypothetical protein